MPRYSIWRRYSYAWITIAFFAFSLAGQWVFGWFAYIDEQHAHGQPVEMGSFAVQTLRDMLENWQSEFLQLLWQVGGLALFFYMGSPQSKEGDDRMEAKIDEILRRVDPQGAEALISQLDEDYAGRHTDARHAHRST
jgi:hypothetical protein